MTVHVYKLLKRFLKKRKRDRQLEKIHIIHFENINENEFRKVYNLID